MDCSNEAFKLQVENHIFGFLGNLRDLIVTVINVNWKDNKSTIVGLNKVGKDLGLIIANLFGVKEEF